MKPTMNLIRALALLLISIPASSQTENKAAMQQSDATQATSILDDIHAVSPTLERYTKDRLFGDLWHASLYQEITGNLLVSSIFRTFN